MPEPNRLLTATTAITNAMAWLSGFLFLILAVYMSAEVLLRYFGGPYTGISDQMASVTLALGGTWALARGLTDGSHVRVDVLMPFYRPGFRRFLHIWSLAMTAAVAAVLAWQAFSLATGSAALGASMPQSIVPIPLAAPQFATAVGVAMLALQAAVMAVSALLHRSHGDADAGCLDTPATEHSA